MISVMLKREAVGWAKSYAEGSPLALMLPDDFAHAWMSRQRGADWRATRAFADTEQRIPDSI
jgi:hypothetical protein